MESAAADSLLQATADNICHCSRDTQLHSLHAREQLQSSPALWRPWILTARADEMTGNQRTSEQDGQLRNFRPKGALGFQHPVRLYLPRSKSSEFLSNIGEKVLASFPVQATIHFYNDTIDSEEDEEENSSAE
ncbi:protein ripply3 [Rhea pennata]|uniref:protein ripply3 n=1 Tax=Rhea pennata TaxID=8795 RepID=UPI002E25FEE0